MHQILPELGHASARMRDVVRQESVTSRQAGMRDVRWRRNASQANRRTEWEVLPLFYDCSYTTPSFDDFLFKITS